MMTGQDFSTLFDNTIDKSYSAFLSTPKKNILFQLALVKGVEEIYKSGITGQRDYDELYSLISTEKVVPVNNNQVSLNLVPITNATFVGLVMTITTPFAHNMITGNTVTISNVQGFTPNPNGSFVVIVLNAFQFTIVIPPTIGAYTAGSGDISTVTMVVDYFHLLAVKAKFLEVLVGMSVKFSLNASPIVITTTGVNNLRTGELITITGVLGNTATNGTYYIQKYNQNKFALFIDKDLITPVVGNGQYISGGTISRTSYDYCKDYVSSMKIDSYSTPIINDPGYAIANKLLKLYPQTSVCPEITIDYMATPPVTIDAGNNVLDLEAYYSRETLYYINDRAAKLFAARFKDEELYNTSEEELKGDR